MCVQIICVHVRACVSVCVYMFNYSLNSFSGIRFTYFGSYYCGNNNVPRSHIALGCHGSCIFALELAHQKIE